MYGFGDVARPLPESVDLMNDIVHEYIQTMTSKAMKIAAKRGKLQIEDFFFVIRKDKKVCVICIVHMVEICTC